MLSAVFDVHLLKQCFISECIYKLCTEAAQWKIKGLEARLRDMSSQCPCLTN